MKRRQPTLTAEARRLRKRFRGALEHWESRLDELEQRKTPAPAVETSAADRAAERWARKECRGK